ncbi:hypothetical protein CF150_07745 [Pseudomonas sp. CF150]|nr:hypothetical protein CF150_07745 [Pseudomonas sp. CF150]
MVRFAESQAQVPRANTLLFTFGGAEVLWEPVLSA